MNNFIKTMCAVLYLISGNVGAMDYIEQPQKSNITAPLDRTTYDLSGLRDYTPEIDEKHEFVSSFKQHNVELHYVVASHGHDRNSATFQLIAQEIEIFQPTMIIVEGMQDDYIPHIITSPEQHNEGEPIFALRMAAERNIPVISGEPSDQDLMTQMHNYFDPLGRSEDVEAFYLLRALRQKLTKNPELMDGGMKDIIENIINSDSFFLKQDYTYEKLDTWLKQKGGDNFNLRLLLTKELEVQKFYSGAVRETNQDVLMREAREHLGIILKAILEPVKQDMLIRDRVILTKILEASFGKNPILTEAISAHALKNTEGATDTSIKLLVIYGGSHFFTQEPVLEKYFGSHIKRRISF